MAFQSIGVIGAGAWGTALAETACLAGRDVVIWAREPEIAREIAERHTNHLFLPGIPLSPAVRATSALADLAACDMVLAVTPAQYLRSVMAEAGPNLKPGTPAVICAKGIEQATGALMVDCLATAAPHLRAAVLSGPSFANDVARGLPAAVTLACADEDLAQALAAAISHRGFRCYWSDDLIAVQLGGAVKNVLAIAAGIVSGKMLGASAHAAMVTRGFAEMCRLAEAMGGRRDTLMGLSGLGDLILTCGSRTSRNMSLGEALGQGLTVKAVLEGRRSVAEGVHTAQAVAQLAAAATIDMPICAAVADVLAGRQTVDAAITALMSRPLKAEALG